MRILNFGSISIDRIYKVPHIVRPCETLECKSVTRVLGGKGANQSIALASAGASVVHLGQISASDSWAIDLMHHAGVDTSLITQTKSPSGSAIIQVDEQGDNATVYAGGANYEFSETAIKDAIDRLTQGDWLLLQNECNQTDQAIRYARQKNIRIAFNAAPFNAGMLSLPLEQVEILFINQNEILALTQQQDTSAALNALAEKYPKTAIVVVLENHGAILAQATRQKQVSAPQLEVLDITAADDTLIGYFLAAQLEAHSDEFSLTWACIAASLASAVFGASSSIPQKKVVDSHYINHKQAWPLS